MSLCRRFNPTTMSPERSAAIAPSLLAPSRGNRQGRVRVVGGCEIGNRPASVAADGIMPDT
jgi:hypothetical protein